MSKLPRVSGRDCLTALPDRKIPDIASYHGKSVGQRGGSDQPINDGQSDTLQTRECGHLAPSLRDLCVDSQYPAFETSRQFGLQPLLQLGPSGACGQQREALSNFSQTEHAQIKGLFVLGVDPASYPVVGRLRVGVFGDDVGIEEVPFITRPCGPGPGLAPSSTQIPPGENPGGIRRGSFFAAAVEGAGAPSLPTRRERGEPLPRRSCRRQLAAAGG